MTYYVPWQPLDVVQAGRYYWNRTTTIKLKVGLHTNPNWRNEAIMAPFVTGYGVLVSKVYYKYSGVTPALRNVYSGIIHDLARILNSYNFESASCKALTAFGSWRRETSYKVAMDLFNKVVGRSNRAIAASAARLAESNLSATERKKIEAQIRNSNKLICMYDFRRDYLRMP